MKEVTCTQCGDTFKRYRAHIRSDKQFCNKECKDAWQSENVRGENHPAYDRVTWHCLVCGDTFDVKRAHAQTRFTCSRKCQGEYRRRLAHEENYYRKAEWLEIRQEVLERDKETCQECSQEGRVVHHIDEDPTNNILENLVTLCVGCHNTVHAQLSKS